MEGYPTRVIRWGLSAFASTIEDAWDKRKLR